MDAKSLEIRISRSENLPVLPQAVSQILKLADDPNSSARDIEKVVERDPAISAKILKVANSAYYGGSSAPTISRAVSFLGMNQVRSLVVGVAFQNIIGTKSSANHFDKIEYWRHSLATATAARILGSLRIPIKAEELFVAGMVHDIGMLVMDKFLPTEFDTCLTTANQMGVPLADVQQDQLGFNYAEIGGLLASRWKMSEMVKNAVIYHPNPMMDGDYYETTSFVTVANALAHQCGFTNNMPGVPCEIDEMAADAVGLPVEQFDTVRDIMVQEVLRAQEAFKIAA